MLRFMLLVSCSALCLNAADLLGYGYVDGDYRIDGAKVRGNATILNGSVMQTEDAAAKLALRDGTKFWVTPESIVKFSNDTVTLLKGLGQIHGGGKFALAAGAIKVTVAPQSIVRVALDPEGSALVLPVRGIAEVTNTRGVSVGRIPEGQAVRFAAYSGSTAAVRGSGCVERSDGGFALTDQITNLTFRLEGRGLESAVGRRVNVLGVADTGMRRVQVTAVEQLGTGTCTTHPGVLLAAAMSGQSTQAPSPKPLLNLVVVEGDGAINNIRQRTAREPIVEVQDENHRPVAGALVLFALPRSGPGATFPNGANTLSVTTDQQGRAVARGLQPNRQSGQYQISVTASYAGATASAVISQTNALIAGAAGAGSAAAATGLGLGTKIAIIAGVSATATVGGLAASGAIFGSGSAEVPASR